MFLEKKIHRLDEAMKALIEFIDACKAIQGYRVAAEQSLETRVMRAKAYLQGCPSAVSGEGGHNTTFRVCCFVGPGFALPPEIAYEIVRDFYNPRCEPPWPERDLRRKIREAYRVEERRGWLVTKK